MNRATQALTNLLGRPSLVLFFCFMFSFYNLVLDGSLLRLWSLHRKESQIQSELLQIKTHQKELAARIDKASDPEFIERQARERFDLVRKNDLVFTFTETDEEP